MSIVIFDALGERLSAYVCELKTGPHSTAARFLQVNWETEKSLISDYCERQFLVKSLSRNGVLDAGALARESQVRRALHVIDTQLYRPRLRRFSTFNARDGFQKQKVDECTGCPK